MSHTLDTRRVFRPLALAGGLLFACAGCGSNDSDTIFDEIGRAPTREDLVEVQLGTFIVPVPVVLESAVDRFEADNLMQIELDLFAVVDPEEVRRVEKMKKRYEGRIRDSVIRVCRNTTRDDLLESQKSTLKAHLLDAIQPMLGGTAVRRLGVQRVILDEL